MAILRFGDHFPTMAAIDEGRLSGHAVDSSGRVLTRRDRIATGPAMGFCLALIDRQLSIGDRHRQNDHGGLIGSTP